MTDGVIAEIVTGCLGGMSLDKATGPPLDAALTAAAEFQRARYNDSTAKTLAGARARDAKATGPVTRPTSTRSSGHRDSRKAKE